MKAEIMREFMQTILQTSASFKQAIQRSLKNNKMGITYEMLQIMSCLWNNEDVNQQELANKTFKDKVSLTYLINNLEKRELVVRQEYAHDRRNKKILLTTKGFELREKLQPLLLEIYTSSSENLETKSLEEMTSFLQKVNYEFKEIK
jgi:DNA-binding MarR family transcriptional regulator